MIIPIRCVTCGKVLADKWEYYKKEVAKLQSDKQDPALTKYFTEPFTKDILDKLGLDKYCCRRHMLGHVDIIDNM
jgi:DNA-directed RNA polymerase I, II, and III subunit RPABC5